MAMKSQAGVVESERGTPRVVPTPDRADRPASAQDESLQDRKQDDATDTKEASVSRSDAPAPKPHEVRHAHLFVTNLDPWSVMKNAFMFAVALGIVMVVAVTVLWAMLSMSGIFDSIASTVTDILPKPEEDAAKSFDVKELFSFSKVVGSTALLAGLEVVLVTTFVTLFAFLYNIAVGITGGLQVTLTNDS